MGFSLKKTLKKVGKVAGQIAALPVTIPTALINKAKLDDDIKKLTSVDTNNMGAVAYRAGNLDSSVLKSKELQTALLDGAKITAGASAVAGTVTATQAVGTTVLANKVQKNNQINLSDVAGLAGYDTTFGGIDFGSLGIANKKKSPISNMAENDFSDYSGDFVQENNNKIDKKVLIIGGGILIVIIMMIFFRGRK